MLALSLRFCFWRACHFLSLPLSLSLSVSSSLFLFLQLFNSIEPQMRNINTHFNKTFGAVDIIKYHQHLNNLGCGAIVYTLIRCIFINIIIYAIILIVTEIQKIVLSEMTENGIVLFLRRCWKLFEVWNEQERRKKNIHFNGSYWSIRLLFINHLHKISDVVYVMYAHQIWNPIIKSDLLAWNRLVFI